MARRRAQKESHLFNNLVIVISVLVLAIFIWREKVTGSSTQNLSSPQDALASFYNAYRDKRANIFRTDLNRQEVANIRDLDIRAGWEGVDVYFTDDDLMWLRQNANAISFAVTLSKPQWERFTPWERFCIAREQVLRVAPWQEYTIVNEDIQDREGRATITIQTKEAQIPVKFAKVQKQWRITGFFGATDYWQGQLEAIEKQLPANMRSGAG